MLAKQSEHALPVFPGSQERGKGVLFAREPWALGGLMMDAAGKNTTTPQRHHSGGRAPAK